MYSQHLQYTTLIISYYYIILLCYIIVIIDAAYKLKISCFLFTDLGNSDVVFGSNCESAHVRVDLNGIVETSQCLLWVGFPE